jgi:hypothetical protein
LLNALTENGPCPKEIIDLIRFGLPRLKGESRSINFEALVVSTASTGKQGKCMQEVIPGDIAIIPPMCRQRITNIGTKDLIFRALCTPRFAPANDEDIDETTP